MDTASPANEIVKQIVKLCVDAGKDVANFESNLENHKSAVLGVEPFLDEIAKLNTALNRPAQETQMLTDLLKQGKDLTEKCSKLKSWEVAQKSGVTAKLKNWRAALNRYIDLMRVVDHKMQLLKSGFSRSCGVPLLPPDVVGLAKAHRELKSMLLLNDSVPAAVVSAPGGYGKTTLATSICHDKDIKDKFGENLFFVTVSKTTNLYAIVKRICKHKGFDPPECLSEQDAINQMQLFFKQIGPDPILLVLDDVWSEWQHHVSQLMFPDIPGFKVLVTSRDNFPKFKEVTYKLKPLSDPNALELFQHSAFSDINNRLKISEVLVDTVVKVCKGNPLALTVVGVSLCGRPEACWKMWIDKTKSESLFVSNNRIWDVLKTSIDLLEETPTLKVLKDLYLDLALFPEDKKIPATLLMDMWIELNHLDERGTYTNAYIHELYYKNLIDLMVTRKIDTEVDFDCDCVGHFVTQHDVLRELAMHLISKESIQQSKRLILDLPKSNLDISKLPNHTRLLSISTDEAVTSVPTELNLSEVEVFILNLQSQNYALPEFMKKMEALKVLIVGNNGYCPTDLYNLQLLSYISTLKRIRLEFVSISLLSSLASPMMNLQKISLTMCNIGDAFNNCTAAMFPSLTQFEIEYCDDLVHFPPGLCSILTLTKLIVRNCQNLISVSEDFGKLTNLEVLELHSCIKLQELPDCIGNLCKLRILNITDCIRLRKLPDQMTKFRSLKKLYMQGCSTINDLPECIEELTGLKLDVICDEEVLHLWKNVADAKARVEKPEVNLDWLHNLDS